MEKAVPQDPVIQHQEVVPRPGFGQHDQVLVESHVAPSSSVIEGAAEFDPFKDADMAIARQVRDFLRKFPGGYTWFIEADIKHQIVKFNIPVLMGKEHWAVINLRTHGTNEAFGKAVVDLAGEILERYGQSRSKFNLGSFLDARAQHSKLIKPWAPIPA